MVELIIFIVVAAIHRFLSTRKSVMWGSILPLVFIAWYGWTISQQQFETKSLIYVGLGLLILCGIWGEGRVTRKKNVRKELDKMLANDL